MSENTMNNLKIGVDVGGTKIEAVLVDAMGTVLGSARIPARHGNDAVIEDIVAVAHQAAGERFDEVRAIGVGTPGTVDSASGHVGNIVNLDVVSLDMGPLISQRSGVPAHVENDVNAAAVGAATVLGGADGMAGTIAFLNFGTGLAAGEVITAELRRRESQCRFLETLDLPARLRLAPVDQPVGAIGAAMAA